jgi:putative FmdB family regulatory protein
MPIYEYRCPNGHLFELFQRIGDQQPEKCEVCGEGPVERVLYPVAVHFKGSGFYTTDYGRGSRRKEAASKDGSDSGSSGEGESKPKKEESKPKAAEA